VDEGGEKGRGINALKFIGIRDILNAPHYFVAVF